MDCYFGSIVDDFVVPTGQDVPDRLPSPESWSKWGSRAPENFGLRNKYFLDNATFTRAEGNFTNEVLSNEDEMDSSNCTKQSSCSGLRGASLDDSDNLTTFAHNQPDYQLDHLTGIEEMDDIFLNCFLEDLPGTENVQGPYCFSTETQCQIIPADYFTSDEHGYKSFKGIKTNPFSQAGSWDTETSSSQYLPYDSDRKDSTTRQGPTRKACFHSQHNSVGECVDEEMSMEESVLQELEMVMTQFTDNTRICFRDAFYRLAHNSKHVVKQTPQEAHFEEFTPTATCHLEKMRCPTRNEKESETNVIDRAIASLLFSKMELNIEVLPVTATENQNQEAGYASGTSNHSSTRSQTQHLHCNSSGPGDCEVPIFGHECQQTAVNYSVDPADNNMHDVYNAGETYDLKIEVIR